MLLADKTAVISGAASARGIGRATASSSPSTAPASPSSTSTPKARRRPPPSWARGISASAATSPTGELPPGRRAGDRRLRQDRHPDQQRRHLPAAEDHGDHAGGLGARARRQHDRRALPVPGLHPAHAGAQAGRHRLHVVRLRAARRRHLRRPALLRRQGRRARPRQGDGARARPGRHPREHA